MIPMYFPAHTFSVCSKCYYSISERLTVFLTVEKPTSECHLSKETNTMHIIQMVQEQHAIYFGYAFFRLILQESKRVKCPSHSQLMDGSDYIEINRFMIVYSKCSF